MSDYQVGDILYRATIDEDGSNVVMDEYTVVKLVNELDRRDKVVHMITLRNNIGGAHEDYSREVVDKLFQESELWALKALLAEKEAECDVIKAEIEKREKR